MTFEIEKGILVKCQRAKYPFGEMDIGDSFFAATAGDEKARQRIQSAASHHSRTYDKRFITRHSIEGGVIGLRVWRLS